MPIVPYRRIRIRRNLLHNRCVSSNAPDKYITRAETVAILNRVLNRAPQNTSDLLNGLNTFNDVSTTSWYYLDVEEAANSHTYTRKTNDYEYWEKLISDPSWL